MYEHPLLYTAIQEVNNTFNGAIPSLDQLNAYTNGTLNVSAVADRLNETSQRIEAKVDNVTN